MIQFKKPDGSYSWTILFNIVVIAVEVAQELLTVLSVFPAGWGEALRPFLFAVTAIGNIILRHRTTEPLGPASPEKPTATLELRKLSPETARWLTSTQSAAGKKSEEGADKAG